MSRTLFDYSESERENTTGESSFSFLHVFIALFLLASVATTLIHYGKKFQTKENVIPQSNQSDIAK